MGAVEKVLILAVAAFNLAVVPGGVGTNEFVVNAEFGSCGFKKSGQMALAWGKTIGEFEAIICLNAFDGYSSSLIPSGEFSQEISRRVGALFFIGGQEAKSGEFVNGSILEQAKFGICNAASWDDLDINLDTLTRILHDLVRLGCVLFLGYRLNEHPFPAHDAKQAFRAACIAALSQPVPEFKHSKGRIPASQIPNPLHFFGRVRIGVVLGFRLWHAKLSALPSHRARQK